MKSMEAFQVVMQMTIMPMIFLSGVFFPVGNLPSWMNFIVKINPASYGIDSIRQLMLETTASSDIALPSSMPVSAISLTLFDHALTVPEEVFIVALFGTLMIGLAMLAFNIQE